uniref:2-oxoisovalerate dehydrogenase subunit beta 1 isoform X2 n=1 Tax=Rhizophora mucronata TaxID=61149 RepID=A0A2P2M130_RHIMU
MFTKSFGKSCRATEYPTKAHIFSKYIRTRIGFQGDMESLIDGRVEVHGLPTCL